MGEGPPRDGHTGVLSLRGYSVAFGEQVVLRGLDAELPARGAFVVLGHGGAGKSTLVRTLAGYNHAQPTLRVWGHARYRGAALHADNLPTALTQNARLLVATVLDNLCLALPQRHALTRPAQRALLQARLEALGLDALVPRFDEAVVELPLAEQRRIAIVRAVLTNPALLMVDEPTAGLDEAGRDAVVSLLVHEATQRAVLYVTHNRCDAMALGGTTALLVRGRFVEVSPTAAFFAQPRTEAGRRWVETGSCYLPTEVGPAERSPEAEALSAPRGFHWIRPGQLAGTARPGLLDDLDDDLRRLQSAGVSVVVNLEENAHVPPVALAARGMATYWLPIPDMGAPACAEALSLVRFVHACIARGHRVAVHCRAGLGRTGTMLSAVLIAEGLAALDALEAVRRVQPRFVQSQGQLDFLERFERFVREGGSGALLHPPAGGDAARRIA